MRNKRQPMKNEWQPTRRTVQSWHVTIKRIAVGEWSSSMCVTVRGIPSLPMSIEGQYHTISILLYGPSEKSPYAITRKHQFFASLQKFSEFHFLVT